MSAAIKPELYATIKLTKGEINLKPQIYATINIIPHLETAKADTRRIITKKESISGDTLRQIGISDSTSGDTKKIVARTEQAISDTKRNVVKSESIFADTLRVLFIPAGAYFKPFIWASIKFAEHQELTRADTLRRLAIPESTQADTFKQNGISNTTIGDTCKIIGNTQSARADTLLKSAISQNSTADTLIKKAILENVHADTLRKVVATESTQADTLLSFVEIARADTLRIITRTSRAIADTVIRVPHVLKYVVENSPVTLHSTKSLRNTPAVSLINSFKDYGVTAINITLNERTLSDDFHLETTRPMDINDAVTGQLLDYYFNFLVEKSSQKELVQTIKGMYDGDKLLYTQIYTDKNFSSNAETTIISSSNSKNDVSGHTASQSIYAYNNEEYENSNPRWKASEYLEKLAEHYGFNINLLFDDFTPYHDLTDTNITYRDLINQLFSWTSRLPQRQINVFIRGNTLHCIQRGKETSVFDISDLPHSRPNVDKQLIRSLWNNPKNGNSSSSISSGGSGGSGGVNIIYPDDSDPNNQQNPIDDYTEDEEEYQRRYSGTIGYKNNDVEVWIKYVYGLVDQEYNSLKNSTVKSESRASYYYLTYGGEEYLSGKQTTTINDRITEDEIVEITTQTSTVENTYFYAGEDGIYLGCEKETNTTTKEEYTLDRKHFIDSDTSTTTRITYHIPIGNGWYAQAVYVDGEAQGSNLSQGKPGNKISPYTIREVNKIMVPVQNTSPNNGGENPSGEDPSSENPSGEDPSGGNKTPDYDDWRNRLSPIVDTTFPVYEISLLYELTDALKWLNRKIQEDISVDLISPINNGIPTITHVVDFTERVALDGKEYYLVSNTIQFTPRQFIQHLKLIRWYAQ